MFNSDSNCNLRNRTKPNLVSEFSEETVMSDVELEPGPSLDWRERVVNESPIWCMDFSNDLVILGCADGRLEFWEATTGKLMVSFVA